MATPVVLASLGLTFVVGYALEDEIARAVAAGLLFVTVSAVGQATGSLNFSPFAARWGRLFLIFTAAFLAHVIAREIGRGAA